MVVALVSPGIAATSDEYRVPVAVFAGEPRGPFQTGTFEELWIDRDREETTTSDPSDLRHLMVQIWYPAQFKGDPPRAPYALHREFYPHDEEAQWLDAAAAVRTHSVLNAPTAKHPKPFPVLIYNPGASHPPFSATFQTEYLASHGYVVVAIGHTGWTRIERFADGYNYRPDEDDVDAAATQTPGKSQAEQLQHKVELYARLKMPMLVKDISFVLDRLQTLNSTSGHRFHDRLDLTRVGSLGWSLGGALSIQASRDEQRVKAAINLDGWLYTDVQKTGTNRPVMIMHGEGTAEESLRQSAAEREKRLFAATLPWQLYAKMTAPWYDVTLAGADHEHFSDRTLFRSADVSAMHPRVAHDIVNRFSLEFFDKYLKGSTNTPLLSGTEQYRDVLLQQSERIKE
ncbi:alpha/beta hydrolase family protein [Steroidobacter sp.]|uniref:alpha/beta hydrolase family protein n=1 Tax=Steroidobacter sp. TaxID=1978227 RepID=UPI001A454BD5|nr:hypothetical protein [Steroidobacter sp.]MBL8264864.1 hypothetical protein [Steroidobacter sp.]